MKTAFLHDSYVTYGYNALTEYNLSIYGCLFMKVLNHVESSNVAGGHGIFAPGDPLITDPTTRVILLATTAIVCVAAFYYISQNSDGQCPWRG